MKKGKLVSEMIDMVMGFYDKDAAVTFNYNGEVKAFSVTMRFKDEDMVMEYAYMSDLSDVEDFVTMKDNLNSFIENVKRKNTEQYLIKRDNQFNDYVSTASTLVGVDVSKKFDCRETEYVMGRQLVMWKLKQTTKLSFRQIGERFGKDHTTALQAIKKINGLIKMDKTFKDEYALILD